ncbi:MAG: DNA topoisomerase [Campylobacterales bacterium]|nr:DNA topoisomerase [Campylobacterales bacterium]
MPEETKKYCLILDDIAKAEQLKQYFPDNYKVIATNGHIENNIPGRIINSEQTAKYEGTQKILSNLHQNNYIFLMAFDRDAKGEEILAQVVEFLKLDSFYRIVIGEINQEQIDAALNKATLYDENKVKALLVEKKIDELVAYKITNAVKQYCAENKKMFFNNRFVLKRAMLSALGIVEASEKAIDEFSSYAGFRVRVQYKKNDITFEATHPFSFSKDTKLECDMLVNDLNNQKYKHIVDLYKPHIREEKPYLPLTMSRLLRVGFYRFGFDPKYTEMLAQKLFAKGLITDPYTDSYQLNEELVNAIIIMLNKNPSYGENRVLQYQRKFKDFESSSGYAIQPTSVDEECFPKRLKQNQRFREIIFDSKKDVDNAVAIYEHIFYITVSSQLKNAFWDETKVEIKVGPHTLKAESSCIAESVNTDTGTSEQLSGWRAIAGKVLDSGEQDDTNEFEIRLPQLFVGEYLKPIGAKAVEFTKKRPPRYGVGRLITTMEKEEIANPSSFTIVYENLVSTGCVEIIKDMVVPQDIGRIAVTWCEEFCPQLVKKDDAKKFNDILQLIAEGEFPAEALYSEYMAIIDTALQNSGYIDPNTVAPTQRQIDYAKKIIERGNIRLSDPDALFSSKLKLDYFLAAHKEKIEAIKKEEEESVIGICPICAAKNVYKNNETKQQIIAKSINHAKELKLSKFMVYKTVINSTKNSGEKFNLYRCENKDCDFNFWENSVISFFNYFKVSLTTDELQERIRGILQKTKFELRSAGYESQSGYLVSSLIDQSGKQISRYLTFKLDSYEKNRSGRTTYKIDFARKG